MAGAATGEVAAAVARGAKSTGIEMMSDDSDRRMTIGAGVDAVATLAERLRGQGIDATTVARIFAIVAVDSAARAQPYAHPELVRDWLFGLLSVELVKARQARAVEIADIACRRARFRVVEGGNA
jgi:hypothetical protein